MVVAVVTPRGPITELDPRTGTIKLTREGFLFLDQLNREVTDIASALIINTITDGITDQAPSSNAVFDAITTINAAIALKADITSLSAYLTIAAAALAYQPLDSQLTSIAALADAAGVLTNDGTGVFSYASAGVITAWVAYTPTFTGLGTVTGIAVFSRRVGDTLEIRGTYTVGTPTATEARLSLGYAGVDGNVTSDATKVPSLQQAGAPVFRNGVSASMIANLIESNVGYLTFGGQTATLAGLSKLNGAGMVSAGTQVAVEARVPISGW